MDVKDEVELFVTLVLGDMKGNAILGLMDRPGPRGQLNRFYDFKYPEQLDKIVEFIDAHRNEDAYLSPLIYGDERSPERRDDTGRVISRSRLRRTPENAKFSNSIYQDSDTCPEDKFRLRPSIHLTSSTGKYQDFWILTHPIPALDAADISRKIAIAHRKDGSDPSSWSANKMLRIPYTTNSRHGFPETVEVAFSGEVYSDLDIAGAYDDVEVVERPIIRLPADVSYESEQDLPDYGAALDKLPPNFDLDILTKEHKDGSDRSRLRYRMLCDLFRAGTLTFEEVLSLAWHAPTSRKWKEDSRNIRGLIAEALRAQSEVTYASGDTILPPDEEETAAASTEPEGLILLTEDERDIIAQQPCWMDRWADWNQHKLGRNYNPPYIRMWGWSILSAAFSDLGFVPRGNGEEGVNLFGIGIGDSGTGKSSSYKLWHTMMNELFGEDKAWDLGSNMSPNALHEALLMRDQKVSVVSSDEAHGWFSQIENSQWMAGLLEVLAKYYDGDVPPILRTGNRELSGKSAKTHFLMALIGTMKGEMSITNVLTRSMFLSGFLARFTWYIGEEKPLTRESMEETQANGEYIAMGYEPMARQWVAEFENTKKNMRIKHKRRRIGMMMDDDALKRLGECKWDIVKTYRGTTNWDILEPALRRIGNNIRRAATLIALEEGADTVSLRHTLIGIQAGEEWLRSLVIMAGKVSDSEWKRLCDDILLHIRSKPKGQTRREELNRKFSSRRPRDLDEQVQALIGQGLIEEKTESGAKWVRLK